MGKILAVWSDCRKSGKSVVTYMLANQMADNGNLKVLVCCLNLKCSPLYGLFGIDSSETGLEDLINYKFYEEKREEILQSIIPRCGNIYFLGSSKMSNSYAMKNEDKYKGLLDILKNSFDLLIVDTVSENDNNSILTKLVLHQADIVIKLYCQDIESMKELRRSKEKPFVFNQQTIHLISQYRDIYPRVADLKRRFGIDKIFKHEYCETLQEMKNRNSLHLYLQRETACNNSIKEISGYLLATLGITFDSKISRIGSAAGMNVFERFYKRLGMAGAKAFARQKWSVK